MNIMKFQSAHVSNITGSIELDKDGHLQRVLTVETDLRLDALHPDHIKTSVDALLKELQEKMGEHYDRAVLKEIERDD